MFQAHSIRVLDLKPIKIFIPYFSSAYQIKTDSDRLKMRAGGTTPLGSFECVLRTSCLTMLLKWPNGLIYSSPRHTPTDYYSNYPGNTQASSQKPVQIKDRWQEELSSWVKVWKPNAKDKNRKSANRKHPDKLLLLYATIWAVFDQVSIHLFALLGVMTIKIIHRNYHNSQTDTKMP